MKWRRFPAVCLSIMLVALLGCSNKQSQSKGGRSSQAQLQQTASPTSTIHPAAPPTQMPHEKTPEEIWNEASPTTRRSILASHIRRTWKNVGVENSGVVMTITHPGMDARGAQQLIDDVGKLAAAAGLRRINFVRAGGICEVTYERPYCEYACQEKMNCSPVDSEACNLICCSIHEYPVEHIPEVRQESCPPHTWVYDVPSS